MYVTKVLVVLDIEEAFILTEFSIAKLDSVWWFEWGTTYICSWRAKLNSSPLLHANMSLTIKWTDIRNVHCSNLHTKSKLAIEIPASM